MAGEKGRRLSDVKIMCPVQISYHDTVDDQQPFSDIDIRGEDPGTAQTTTHKHTHNRIIVLHYIPYLLD